MKIILNSGETRGRNKSTTSGNYKPTTLEIVRDGDDEGPFTIGLFITADRRDLGSEDGNVFRFTAGWCTPREFARWVGQLVRFAILLGLTDSDD
jgi:hypothetical protein